MYNQVIGDIQVRELLANHINKRKLNKISIDNLNVLSVNPFSAVIVSMQKLIYCFAYCKLCTFFLNLLFKMQYLLKTTYVAQKILTKYTYIDSRLSLINK
jgi:hypothetical protein